MFKKYMPGTQKGKTIRIMLLKWVDKWYKWEELMEYNHFFTHIFIWWKVASRLSELLKEWIVQAEYFDNENACHKWMSRRARYKLTPQAVEFYKTYYSLIW